MDKRESSHSNVDGFRLLRQRQSVNYSQNRKYVKQVKAKASSTLDIAKGSNKSRKSSSKLQKRKNVKLKRVKAPHGKPCGCNTCYCNWCNRIKAPNVCAMCIR